MDMVDYFIEECRDGACRRENGFQPLQVRTENILRKKAIPYASPFVKANSECWRHPPTKTNLADGFYLARAWSAQSKGAAASLDALARLPHSRTVAEGQHIVREVAISCNWLLADREGNIGYQQSGLLPDRRHSGLYPVPAWEEKWHWRGTVASDRLHTLINPRRRVSRNSQQRPEPTGRTPGHQPPDGKLPRRPNPGVARGLPRQHARRHGVDPERPLLDAGGPFHGGLSPPAPRYLCRTFTRRLGSAVRRRIPRRDPFRNRLSSAAAAGVRRRDVRHGGMGPPERGHRHHRRLLPPLRSCRARRGSHVVRTGGSRVRDFASARRGPHERRARGHHAVGEAPADLHAQYLL